MISRAAGRHDDIIVVAGCGAGGDQNVFVGLHPHRGGRGGGQIETMMGAGAYDVAGNRGSGGSQIHIDVRPLVKGNDIDIEIVHAAVDQPCKAGARKLHGNRTKTDIRSGRGCGESAGAADGGCNRNLGRGNGIGLTRIQNDAATAPGKMVVVFKADHQHILGRRIPG